MLDPAEPTSACRRTFAGRPGFRDALLALGLLGLSAGGGAAQEPVVPSDTTGARPIPADTYADPGVRELIQRARRERQARARGLAGFEVRFRERIYAGVSGRLLRRERAMFHQERAARVYWDADGERVVRWLGVRRGVPLIGLGIEFEDDLRRDDAFDIDFDFLDPADEQLFMGSDWALHPLADTAGLHYRYRSGDTLRIRFPGSDRTVTLVEAVVEPREARFDLIVGSLWFDLDEGMLTRAAYRPAIDFDLEREEPEDAEDVPGFVKPIRATVDFITADYGLQELRWWLPNRMAFDGTASAGGLATMPIRFEWVFDQYEIGEQPEPDLGDLPDGWTSWTEEEDYGTPSDSTVTVDAFGVPLEERARRAADSLPQRATRVTHIVPPTDSLHLAPDLPEPLFSGSVDAFQEAELDQLRDRLGSIAVPAAAVPGPRLDLGIWPGRVRYNRVEGVAPSARFTWPTGVTSAVSVTPRIATSDWEPGLEVEWRDETPRGSFGVGVYRRLIDLEDWGRPLGFGNSLNGLLTGYDDGLYFRETGLEIVGSRSGARARWEGRLFAERHQNAPKQTDASVPNWLGDRLFPSNVTADRGEIVGVSGRVRLFTGVDPAAPVVSTTIWGEAAAGDFDYGRLALSGALQVPFGPWSAAVEAGTGAVFGNPPAQRLYYLGGPYTLRAFEPGAAGGEAFWLGRVELGRAVRFGPRYGVGGAAFRVAAFGDAAWAGPRDAFGTEGWQASVGAGLSFMEGFFRIDLAKAVRGASGWRLHIYTDGLM